MMVTCYSVYGIRFLGGLVLIHFFPLKWPIRHFRIIGFVATYALSRQVLRLEFGWALLARIIHQRSG